MKRYIKESNYIGDKIFKLNGINLKDWYTKEYPNDELGYELNDDVDLRRCFSSLGRDPDIYDVMGVGDSVIRERVFAKMADVLGVDYDVIYYKWLGINEGLNEDFRAAVDWMRLENELWQILEDKLTDDTVEVYFDEAQTGYGYTTSVKYEILWGGDEDGFATTDIKGTMFGTPAQVTMTMHFPNQRGTEEVSVHNIDEMANALIEFGNR